MIDQYGRTYKRFRVDVEKDWAGFPCLYSIWDYLRSDVLEMDRGRQLIYTEPGCIGVQDICDDLNARFDRSDIVDHAWRTQWEEYGYE